MKRRKLWPQKVNHSREISRLKNSCNNLWTDLNFTFKSDTIKKSKMDPSMVFSLLIVITVTASSHPLDTTTLSPDDPNKIFFTVPSGSSGNISLPPIKSSASENRLEITLKMDESDKEIVDSDMGKYLETTLCSVLICKKVFLGRRMCVNKSKILFAQQIQVVKKGAGCIQRSLKSFSAVMLQTQLRPQPSHCTIKVLSSHRENLTCKCVLVED